LAWSELRRPQLAGLTQLLCLRNKLNLTAGKLTVESLRSLCLGSRSKPAVKLCKWISSCLLLLLKLWRDTKLALSKGQLLRLLLRESTGL
jgi:hypothetical protein